MTWNGSSYVKNPPLEGKLRMLTAEELAEKNLVVGSDHRVYRRTQGSIVADVPAKVYGDENALLYTNKLDRSTLPPLGQIGHLFDAFMAEYDREILVWIGQDRTDPARWHYMVPKQKGTSARVEYDDPDGSVASALAMKARWVGSIHTHPGNSARYSGVDSDNWKQSDCTGFHFIVARDRSYTICAVIGGCTWEIEAGQLPPTAENVACEYDVAHNLPLDQVLLEPPKWTPSVGFHSGRQYDFGHTAHDFGDYYSGRQKYGGKTYDITPYRGGNGKETSYKDYDTTEWGWWDQEGFHPWDLKQDKPLSRKQERKVRKQFERRGKLYVPKEAGPPPPRSGEKPFLDTDLDDYFHRQADEFDRNQMDLELGLDTTEEQADIEALIDILREEGAVELSKGNEGFEILVIQGRGFIVPSTLGQELAYVWEEDTWELIEHHWRGSVELEKGGVNVYRA